MHYPDNALFCEQGPGELITHMGNAEGHNIEDIQLDIGCSKTMVWQNLIKGG